MFHASLVFSSLLILKYIQFDYSTNICIYYCKSMHTLSTLTKYIFAGALLEFLPSLLFV